MTKERLKSPRARLFVALDLPDETRREIEAWGERELSDPALRPLPADSLHVTLVFLGYRPEKEIEEIAGVLERAGSFPAQPIRLLDPVRRPERGRARLYALPIDSAGLVDLQSDLEGGLASAGLHEPEKRRFWPHLTVARVRPEKRGSRRPRVVQRPPGPLPQGLLQPILGVRVSLYRSELKPWGATYSPLAHIDLR
jgi:2'-5' RNA ligase